MAAPKGTRPPAAGMGRKKGVPNKATREFRETVQKLLDDNRENVSKWLTLVAEGDPDRDVKPDPGKALTLLKDLAEFAAPKLARTEVVGKLELSDVSDEELDEKLKGYGIGTNA